MLIDKAFQSGRELRRAILSKNIPGGIPFLVYKFQSAKHNPTDLSYEYLKACLDFDVHSDNSFIVDMLAEDVDITSEDVGTILCLGLTIEDI